MNKQVNQQLVGGKVSYYLVRVENPQREEQAPYQAECEDIIRALNMTFAEGCEFKAIWRTAAARLGNGKPGHQALYDAQKRLHYAAQDVAAYELQKRTPEYTDWVDWKYGDTQPTDAFLEIEMTNGKRRKDLACGINWGRGTSVVRYRILRLQIEPTNNHQ